MSKIISPRKQWFVDRIGKTVFRNDNLCDCEICKGRTKNGVLIKDESHADHLCNIEVDYNREGYPLQYFDTKEEVENWLKTL